MDHPELRINEVEFVYLLLAQFWKKEEGRVW